MEAGLNRVPMLEHSGITHFMNGPESFTPDTRQAMGESPFLKGYFRRRRLQLHRHDVVRRGRQGNGRVGRRRRGADGPLGGGCRAVRSSMGDEHLHGEPGAGSGRRAIRSALALQADEDRTRRAPLAIARCVRGGWRGVRRNRVLGAALLVRRRPVRAGDSPTALAIRPGGPRPARGGSPVRDRAASCRAHALHQDRREGPDQALRLLQHLCANDLGSRRAGPSTPRCSTGAAASRRTSPSPVLARPTSGIVSGAATRLEGPGLDRAGAGGIGDVRRGLWRHRHDLGKLSSGRHGPPSRTRLAEGSDRMRTCRSGPSPSPSSHEIEIAGIPVRATRISFVGEAGWELYIPVRSAAAVS